MPQGEVCFEALVNAVANRIPGGPELVFHRVDTLGEAAIRAGQNDFFDILARGIDFVFALRHSCNQPAPMPIGKQASFTLGGRFRSETGEQPIAEPVAGNVRDQRRIGVRQLLATASDVVERAFQAEQILIITRPWRPRRRR